MVNWASNVKHIEFQSLWIYVFVDSNVNGFSVKIVFHIFTFLNIILFLTTLNIILIRCFFRLRIFWLEPSPSMYLFTFLVCGVSYHHRKRLTFVALVFPFLLLLWDYLIFIVDQVYEFPVVRLFLIMLYAVLVNIFPLLP